jgi:iron complex transport system substrate-binding protein
MTTTERRTRAYRQNIRQAPQTPPRRAIALLAAGSSAFLSVALAAFLSAALLSCGIGRPAGHGDTERGDAAIANRANGALRVVSLAPASTSMLLELGAGNLLVATDSWSTRLPGVPSGLPAFDMMKPDVERLAELAPDILLVSALTEAGTGVNPFSRLEAAGMKVVVLPSSADLAGIAADMTRVALLVGRAKEGERAVQRMNEEVARIEAIARQIPQDKRRTVVFEIESAPWIYSFGSGVYLDDLLSKAGAKNAFSGERGWIAVSAEAVIAANPDVILTNVATDDPVGEIMRRPGWGGVKAVKAGRVYRIDNTLSSQPAPACVGALKEIAEAVYPEYFK